MKFFVNEIVSCLNSTLTLYNVCEHLSTGFEKIAEFRSGSAKFRDFCEENKIEDEDFGKGLIFFVLRDILVFDRKDKGNAYEKR